MTLIVADIGAVLELVAEKDKLPFPLAPRPIAVFELVHA